MKHPWTFAAVALLLAGMGSPLIAVAGDMKTNMPMTDKPATFKPTREVYTTDHRFLVKLVSLPTPIPFEHYFKVKLAVYQGKAPHAKVEDANVEVAAGMRHGQKTGFAHGMDSSPKVAQSQGEAEVSGMYFHMMGPWVMEVTVHHGGKPSVAYFMLPCCGK